MKGYYSILKSFFSKTNNQERLSQLEKIKNNQTALIKLFNQIKPESKDYSINKNTMKLSELKAYIREEIINTLSEVTIVDKQTTPDEATDIAKQEKKDINTVKSAIDTAKKTGKAVNIAEEEDIYDFDEKEPSKADLKKDSVATTANKLQKLTAKMKELAKEYSKAEGAKKEKIKDQLKDMTKEKKQLEKAL